MGGPRASTERMVARGERCAKCYRYLGSPPARFCEGCDPASPSSPRKPVQSDRIYDVFLRMAFLDGVWYCDFYESNLATRIGKRREIKSEKGLRDMIHRTARNKTRAGLRMADHDIDSGSGDVWLLLNREQYEALKR